MPMVEPISRRSRNHEWVPLAIGAVILFLCAALLFIGGHTIVGALAGNSPTAIQAKAAGPTGTAIHIAVPTVSYLVTPGVTATAAPVLAKVIEARVNVRAAPNTQATIVGKIKKDEEITLIGRSEDGAWYEATIGGIAPPSWVFGETLEISRGAVDTLPLVKP
ncbi:MAG: SH3 domain-containing protein [Acidobacteriota bacterium]